MMSALILARRNTEALLNKVTSPVASPVEVTSPLEISDSEVWYREI